MTDEHCLRLAQSIRTILVDLAERASEALKDNKEIKTALSVLISMPSGSRGVQK
jgi:phage baseplate assembly protein W